MRRSHRLPRQTTKYLILVSTESSCCGDLCQLWWRLFPKDFLQQDEDFRRLWWSLQQHCQTTVPVRAGLELGFILRLQVVLNPGIKKRTTQLATGSGNTSSPEVRADERPRRSRARRCQCHLEGRTGSPPFLSWGLELMIRNLER